MTGTENDNAIRVIRLTAVGSEPFLLSLYTINKSCIT
jgi:hypothetical protein